MIDLLYDKYIEANQKICTDTRNIIPGSIFFALRGDNFDGNKFANEAIKKGARFVVIDNPDFNSSQTILVKNTLEALQKLAKHHRRKNKFQVIGITGTNGKTTTKELIYAVLSKQYKCHATKGNLNNHIGVPLTILSSPPETELLIVEMGANHIGEIELLCQIAEPDCGLITNIGKAHLEGFGGFNGVIRAKSELYNYLFNNERIVFFNEADKLLTELVDNKNKLISYGTRNSNYYADKIGFDNGIKISLHANNKQLTISTNLFGDYNITNILAATRVGSHFNIPLYQIAEALNNYTPQNHRSQIIKTSKNTLVLDSYNANPSSMQAAINSFDEIKSEKKLLILGSMKELGESSKHEHNELIKLARSLKTSMCFFVGSEFSSSQIESEKLFPDTNKLIEYLVVNRIEKHLILIKGSRANKLEEIATYL